MEPEDKSEAEPGEQVELLWGHLILVVKCVCISLIYIIDLSVDLSLHTYVYRPTYICHRFFSDWFLIIYHFNQQKETGLIFSFGTKTRFLWKPPLIQPWFPPLDQSIMPFEARSRKDHCSCSDQVEGLTGMGWMVYGMWSEENSASKTTMKF